MLFVNYMIPSSKWSDLIGRDFVSVDGLELRGPDLESRWAHPEPARLNVRHRHRQVLASRQR